MPRSKLETREQRKALAGTRELVWVSLGKSLALGYRAGARGGVWWVRERVKGKYKKRSLGKTDDFRDADGRDVLSYRQVCHLATGGEKAREEHNTAAYLVSDAVEAYLAWYRVHRKSIITTEASVRRHILPALGHLAVDELAAKEIRSWHERMAAIPAATRNPKRDLSIAGDVDEEERTRRRRASANRVLTILRAALSHAFQHGEVEDDREWRRVKPFRGVDASRANYLEVAEAKRLVNACEPGFRELVKGALCSGARYSELTALRVEDYNADAGTIHIRKSKSGKGRHVPLSAEGVELIEEITAGRKKTARIFTRYDGVTWGRSDQVRRMKDACRVAKIELIGFHGLRHFFASQLVMRGVPLLTIAKLLGHSTTQMVERHYGHLSPSHIADAVRANLPRIGKKQPAKLRRIK